MRRALYGLGLLTLVFVARSVAQPRLADEALVAPEPVWRALRPLVTALGDGLPGRAVDYVRAALALVQKAEEHLDCDAATLKFRDQALASIADFDLKEFYLRLPSRDGDTRFFALWGAPTRAGYLLRMGHGIDVDVHARSKRRGFGDISSMMRMRHRETDDNARYAFEARGGAGVGARSWSAIATGTADAIAMLSEPAPASPVPFLLQTADSHLKKSQPALHEADRAVLARVATGFPNLFKEFDRVFQWEDIVVDALHSDGARRARCVLRLDLVRMTGTYPALVKFLRRFGDLMAVQGQLVDGHNRPIARFSFDTEHMRIRLEADTKDGALVPLRGGSPANDAPADFRRMKLHTEVHVQAYGLHVDVADFVTELTTRRTETGASLRAQMRRTPRIRTSGAAFGVFPASMLDWFVPGDIESLARKMLDVTMKGNGGEGVLLDLGFAQPTGQLATIEGAVALEILDTRLIRFGMKIAADHVMPDDDASRELTLFLRHIRGALRADVERYARFVVTQ